jgi:hypothetical protein
MLVSLHSSGPETLISIISVVYCESLSLHIFGSLCNFIASAGRALVLANSSALGRSISPGEITKSESFFTTYEYAE